MLEGSERADGDAVQLGEGRLPSTACGPLVNKASLHKVEELVADAVARGARISTTAVPPRADRFFYQPTVLVDVPVRRDDVNNYAVLRSAVNPMRFHTAEEVVEHANRTPWTRRLCLHGRSGQGLRIAERLESGMIALNRGLTIRWRRVWRRQRERSWTRGRPSRPPRIPRGQIHRRVVVAGRPAVADVNGCHGSSAAPPGRRCWHMNVSLPATR